MKFLALAIIAASALTASEPAFACRFPIPAAKFENSDLVVEGTARCLEMQGSCDLAITKVEKGDATLAGSTIPIRVKDAPQEKNEGDTITLGRCPQTFEPWAAEIAGRFYLKGSAKAGYFAAHPIDNLNEAAPQPSPQPLTIGETITLSLNDTERAVNIVLPPDYAKDPDKRWPVIYQLDGAMNQDLLLGSGLLRWNALWGRSEDAILVGITTLARQTELLPASTDPAEVNRYPTAGESAVFREWITQTVKPMIEARYRTDGRAFFVGESAAGHFVVETWALSPQAFTGYAAISPSLQWDFEALSRKPLGSATRPPLYLSLADEGGTTESGMMRLLDALPPGQPFCFSDRRTELHHATALHGLLPEALQYLMPTKADWLTDFGMVLRCERRGGAG